MTENYDVYVPSRDERDIFVLGSWLVTGVILYVFYRSIIVLIPAFPLSVIFLRFYCKYKAGKRKELFIMQFMDLLYSISASVGSGRSLKEALRDGEEELGFIYDENTPLIKELSVMNKRISELNENEDILLKDLGERSGVRDIRTFAEVSATAKLTGADLVKVTADTARMLLDKMTIVRDIRSYTAQKRFEGRVIALMPLITVAFLNMISPEYFAPLYAGFQGRAIMTLALILTVTGLYYADKATDIDVWKDSENKKRKRAYSQRTSGIH